MPNLSSNLCNQQVNIQYNNMNNLQEEPLLAGDDFVVNPLFYEVSLILVHCDIIRQLYPRKP